MDGPIPSVLVAARGALEKTGGGVQQASREYIAALQLAGFKLEVVSFEPRATPLARLWNRLRPAVMFVQMPKGLPAQVECCMRAVEPEFVFFYPNIFPELSRSI